MKNGLKTKFKAYTPVDRTNVMLVLDKKLHVGSSTLLEIANLKEKYEVEVTSSNRKVAVALKDGTVVGKAKGDAVITITIQSGVNKYKYCYNVRVVD